MFDVHKHVTEVKRTEYVPYEKTVNITEKKAPTDQSIKLLNEFQDKAKENLISMIRVEDNLVNGVFAAFEDGGITDDVRWYAKFKLNGKEHTIQGVSSRTEFQNSIIHASIEGKDVMFPMLILPEITKKVADLLFAHFIGAPKAAEIISKLFRSE